MSADHPIVNISSQPIELCKLLKIANMVSGGGEAKIVISEGYVYLNGDVEFQKRKKVYENDVIEFNGEIVQVFCTNDAKIKAKVPQTKTGKSKAVKSTNQKAKKNNQLKSQQSNKVIDFTDAFEPSAPTKRRPISF